MKFRYIVRKFIDAENLESAIKKEKRTRPHEIYIDNEVWKNNDFSLTDNKKLLGYDSSKDKKTK